MSTRSYGVGKHSPATTPSMMPPAAALTKTRRRPTPMTERKPNFGVGYLLPPAEKQFKKGQSGNPSGRPKGAKSLRTVIKEAASKKLSVVEDGKRKKKSKMDLMVTQMFNRAAQGEARFTQMELV